MVAESRLSAYAMPLDPRNESKVRWLSTAISALAILGMADSGLLTIHHFHHMNLPTCGSGHCERVLTSWYAHPFFGIPTSVYGFAYYAMIYLLPSFNVPPRRLVPLAALAFCIHLGFVGVQAFIIHAFCNYCLLSAATTTLIFILMMALARASGPPKDQ